MQLISKQLSQPDFYIRFVTTRTLLEISENMTIPQCEGITLKLLLQALRTLDHPVLCSWCTQTHDINDLPLD
jgi:hypothetical protein